METTFIIITCVIGFALIYFSQWFVFKYPFIKTKKQLLSGKYLVWTYKSNEFATPKKIYYEIIQVGNKQVQLKDLKSGYITVEDIDDITLLNNHKKRLYYEVVSDIPYEHSIQKELDDTASSMNKHYEIYT